MQGVRQAFRIIQFAGCTTAVTRTVQIAERARESGRAGDPLSLSVANRLFGPTGYAFRRPFPDLTRDRYAAPFEAVDFESYPDGERRALNRWVEEKTRSKCGWTALFCLIQHRASGACPFLGRVVDPR